MRKAQLARVALFVLLAAHLSSPGAAAQRGRRIPKRPAAVCPDPTARCKTSVPFEPHQLPFVVPPNAAIFETEKFYAVILTSGRDKTQDCAGFVPEPERLEAQKLFPRNKVFASRCYEPDELYYEGIDPEVRFMAVYAGRTRAEAQAMLAKVKATGKFPGAYLRRTSTGFNGT
ncbi:MAG TPA: hypothetical protein VKB12_12685 [Pyrinomonadaceae bacterium]|nr:hypothetical protein [Pyrinomonadaceae bacterium]